MYHALLRPALLLAFVSALLSLSGQSHAAVFKCVTSAGVAKFSNKPCPAKAFKGDTDAHKLYAELQTFLVKGSDIISSAQGGTAGIIRCQKSQKQFLKQMDSLTASVRKQEQQFKGFQKSYDLLRQCGACQSRARRYCGNASKELSLLKSAIVNSQVKSERPGWARRY